MTTAGTTPPGWYDDGQGWLRWFDGERWTDHVHGQLPVTPPAALPGVGVTAESVNAALAEEAAQAPAAPDGAPEADRYEDEGGHVQEAMVLADPKLADVPLYRRRWFVASLVLVVLLAVVAAVAGRESDDVRAEAAGTVTSTTGATGASPSASASASRSVSSSASPSASSSPTASGTASMDVLVDGAWTLSSFNAQKEKFTESFAASGRITYRGKSTDAWGNFTVTLTKDGRKVASMLGAIASIERGKSKRVEFVSTDRFVPGPYTVRFQRER